jgi:hypothetical protein
MSHFLLGQRSLFLSFVVPVPAEDLAYRPETQLGRLGHEDIFVAMQKRADLQFCEQPGTSIIDDDVGHALEKFKNRQVLLFAEVDPHAFIGGVATDHGHSLQPCDRIAQIGVNLDAACHAGLIKATDRERPLVWRQRLDRQPPEPDVAMGHVVIAVGQDDPVGRPGSGIDGRKRHRHVGLAGPAEARANGYHARFERGLADGGHRVAPPLRGLLTPGPLTLAGRDDKAVPHRPPRHGPPDPLLRRRPGRGRQPGGPVTARELGPPRSQLIRVLRHRIPPAQVAVQDKIAQRPAEFTSHAPAAGFRCPRRRSLRSGPCGSAGEAFTLPGALHSWRNEGHHQCAPGAPPAAPVPHPAPAAAG